MKLKRFIPISSAEHRRSADVLPGEETNFTLSARKLRKDKPLSRHIVDDLEQGVTSRPSVPSCFEESDELGVVDPDCDIRSSTWDRLANEFNPETISRKNAPKEPIPDPTPNPNPTE